MHFQWEIFIAAIGLVFVLEGLTWFLGPELMKKIMSSVQDTPAHYLRVMGLIAIVVGLGLVALYRVLG